MLLLLFADKAKGQLPDYHLQLFNHHSGIRPGNIRGIARDKEGFLWISYDRLVQRFDGRRVHTFRPGGRLGRLTCDGEGRVWITTENAVLLLSPQRQFFEPVGVLPHPQQKGPALQPGEVFQLGKAVLLITTHGFYAYHPASGKFRPALARFPVAPPYILSSFAVKGSTLFLAKNGFLYRYDVHAGHLDSLPQRQVMRTHPMGDSVLVSTWQAKSFWLCFRKKTITEVRLQHQERLPASIGLAVGSVASEGKSRYLIVTRDGIFRYDAQDKTFRKLQLYHQGNPLVLHDLASTILVDEQGFSWLATPEGVYRFALRSQQFGLLRIRRPNDSLPTGTDNFRAITEDDKGQLWMATANGLVRWHITRNQWQLFPHQPGARHRLAHDSIKGILWDGRNLLLAADHSGIWLVDPRTQRYRRPRYSTNSLQSRSQQDYFGGVYAVGASGHLFTGKGGLYLLDRQYNLCSIASPASSEHTSFAFRTGEGVVWVTTQKGLHCFDSTLRYLGKAVLPFANPYIGAGTVLPDGRLLFAAEAGLFTASCRKGRIRVKAFSQAFNGLGVSALYADSKGMLWAAADEGIYHFDPRTGRHSLYDYTDNVQGYGFNSNSCLYSRSGILFFGGTNGLNYLRPEMFGPPGEHLQVRIQEVRSGRNNRLRYNLDGQPHIPYADRSLVVSFSAPYFNNPDKLQYRYRLNQEEEDWRYMGNNSEVRFSSLAPGSYQLMVEASINGADWVAAQRTFDFSIGPPFYLSGWFLLLLLVMAGFFVYGLYRRRNRKLAQKQAELEAEQAINYFSASIYEHHSIDAILWDVARNCIGRLHFEDCVVYLVDARQGCLVQKAAYGPKTNGPHEIWNPISIPLGKGITGSVALSGRAEIIADTTKDPRYIVDDAVRLSEITVPIVFEGQVLGVIDCEHSKKGFFTHWHLNVLQTIASLCASKIIKARAEAERIRAEQVLMDTKERMANIEMQALRAQMNPHFIFNCLNSINRYIVKSDQRTASLYLTRFAKLIRMILDHSQCQTVTLANELKALRLYIEMESIRFDHKYQYHIDVAPALQQDNIFVPPMIIQPFVENAIWHGLLHKQTPGALRIRIGTKSPGLLECVVEDDGVGREQAGAIKSRSTTRKSLGMQLTRDRLALLGEQLQQVANVAVFDLKDALGNAAGTRVVLTIPVE